MSTLQRTTSAPHLPEQPRTQATLLRSISHQDVQKPALPHRLKPLAPKVVPFTISPNAEREDPFNLLGFFPTSVFGLNRDEEWHWLREDVIEESTEDEAGYSEEDVDGSSSAIFIQAEDKHMSEAIKGEDKLGVLSLDSLFSWRREEETEDVGPLSPYQLEVVDEDSLYLSLRDRRRVVERENIGPTKSQFGQLFFPGNGRC